MKYIFIIVLFFVSHLPLQGFAEAGTPVPRIVYGVYSSQNHPLPKFSFIHQFLEMPLNHLGYDVHNVDIEKTLPPVGKDVAAIIVWLVPGTSIKDANPYLDWLEKAVDGGTKLIIIENLGISTEFRDSPNGIQRMNRLLNKIGVQDLNTWNELTYQGSILYKDPSMVEFERPYPKALNPYMDVLAVPGFGKSYLKVRAAKDAEVVSDLVITSPKGGYIASGYAMFEGYQQSVPDAQQSTILSNGQIPGADGPSDLMATPGQTPQEAKEDAEEAIRRIDEELARKDQHTKDDHIFPIQQWYINPFHFLRSILKDENIPKPDYTTLNGRRIFYSHIDADGWNNISEVSPYRKHKAITAEVVRKEILELYPDIPFNVSLITSEVDLKCYGLKQSAEEAKAIFALPNVEPSSHTHSHPLAWNYFADADPDKERPLLKYYPEKPGAGTSFFAMVRDKLERAGESQPSGWKAPASEQPEYFLKQLKKNEHNYENYGMRSTETPRSYACSPFNIEQEIKGAIDIINRDYAPKNKKARLVQWSGDTTPFPEALRIVRENGLLNINGGDSRYDNEYPSYASVSPLGLKMGEERQIYSSNSNENTYTNLWTDRFYGFVYLQSTVRNTDRPLRVQPFNIYFHVYSGEKQASLNAVKANLNFAITEDVIPIFASDFAEIAQGFYSTEIIPQADGGWKVQNRGKLNTVRFDNASLIAVDFSRSKGVMGQRYYQGSLYVSLDPSVETPQIYMKPFGVEQVFPHASEPYLIESNRLIKGLHKVKKSLMFEARGWGDGNTIIKFPKPSKVVLNVLRDGKNIAQEELVTDEAGALEFELPVSGFEPLNVTITEY